VGSSHDAWIFKSLADATIVELVKRWRTMSQSFPFVVLPDDYDPRNAFHSRSMLTFAAVVVASSYDASLQQSLASEFRQALSARLLTTTDNKLDLLQGLLIFVAWHHQYMESKGASVYMLMQIAVGLLLDLRIDKIRPEEARNAGQAGADSREKQRAYIGSYYLCCGLSLTGLDRPRNFPYSENLRLCAEELATLGEYGTDRSLSTLMEVFHLIEDVQASLSLGHDGHHSLRGDVLHSRLQVKRLEERWKALQQTVPSSTGTLIQWSLLYSQAYMYKVCLFPPVKFTDNSEQSFQVSILVSCTRTIDAFLGVASRTGAQTFRQLAIVDWMSLISALVLIGRLSKHPVAASSSSTMGLAEKLDYYLDLLDLHMPGSHTAPHHESQETSPAEDLFTWFRRVALSLRDGIRKPTMVPTSTFVTSTYESAQDLDQQSRQVSGQIIHGSIASDQGVLRNQSADPPLDPSADDLAWESFFPVF